jgi:pyruvate/2-oxoglutarate/acetoin dehydrogenase E1 component
MEVSKMVERQINFREAIIEATREEMRRDERVFLMGEDVGALGGVYRTSIGLLKEFGEERVLDTPLSEAAIAGFTVGAAMVGMRPIVEIMRIDWITLCMDEIVNQAAKIRFMSGGQVGVPMTLRVNTGAGIGLGPQHSSSFESWFVHVPGLKVVMPSTPFDCKGLLKAAIRDPDPVIFMESVLCLNVTGTVPEEDYVVPLGEADLKTEGKDVTIVAWGTLVHQALNAAKTLSGEGIQAEVVDLRTLNPLDIETIVTSVKKTGKVVVAHEAVKMFGPGAEIVALIQEKAFDHLDAPIQRVAAPFAICPANRNLERMTIPQEQQIIEAVKSTF